MKKWVVWLVIVLVLLVSSLVAGCAKEWVVQPGEEFELGSRLICYDCSLVHNVTYRIEDGRVLVKMWRNKYLTAKRRKHLQEVNE